VCSSLEVLLLCCLGERVVGAEQDCSLTSTAQLFTWNMKTKEAVPGSDPRSFSRGIVILLQQGESLTKPTDLLKRGDDVYPTTCLLRLL